MLVGADGKARFFDVETGNLEFEFYDKRDRYSGVFLKDDRYIIFGTKGSKFDVFDLESKTLAG